MHGGRSPFASLALTLCALASLVAPVLADPAAAPGASDPRFGIVEGFRRPDVMQDIGFGWERVMVSWAQIQPDNASDFSHLGLTLPPSVVDRELGRGTKMAGLLQFTPGWAQANSADGQRSVPKNLYLPFDDPNNYWGQFVYRTARFYRGKIDTWVLWNEPEWRASDGEDTYTWAGTDADFAQLTKVGYLAVKKANPSATVSFAGASYWVEVNRRDGRPLLYDRVLAELARDPNAPANDYYHDVAALNIYQSPDDVLRVYGVYRAIMQKYGLDKPIWLTETNAMPKDDLSVPCAAVQSQVFPKTTMAQQADFALQTVAMAAAAGYGQIEYYQMVDADSCHQPAVWGIARDDGSLRPVARTLRTAVRYFSGYTNARFIPLARVAQQWPTWPDDPTSALPNWQVYLVALDRPNRQRVSVLWNGDGTPLRARIKQTGTSAVAVDENGKDAPLALDQGWWVVDLPAATAHGEMEVGSQHFGDPPGYHYIGGSPILIVEEGVDPATPVGKPHLGDPGSVQPDFVVANASGDQSIGLGSSVDYFLTTAGVEDFGWPIDFSVLQWSTQRFPDWKYGSTLPFGQDLPRGVAPGTGARLHFDTAGADPGIYYITVQATATNPADPSQTATHTVDLALVVS